MNRILPPDELISEGYLQEANRRFFHPLGLALAVDSDGALLVLDARDDPEGIVFVVGDGEEPLHVKADRVAAIEAERLESRKLALGFWIQDAMTNPSAEKQR